MTPVTAGANSLTTSRTAEGKTLTPRTISMSSVRPMQRTRGAVRPQAQRPDAQPHVIAGAEAQQRRRAVDEMGEHELALGAVDDRLRLRRSSGSISSKCTKPRPLKCMPAFASHSPHSETEMSPMPIASVTLAPQPASSLRPHRRLAAAGFARDHHPLDAGARQIHAALARPFDEMQRIGRRHRDDGRFQELDRRHQPLGVSGADRDMAEARAGRRRRAPRRRRTGRRCRSRRCVRRA